jgi:hypothetical protein
MALGDIDLTLPARNVELFLAKPNREIVAKLTEAYNKKLLLKLGNINEITFTIPYDVDKNKKLTINPHMNLLRERYLIKAVFSGKVEWYKIINIVNAMSEGDSMDVTCYLLPYELSDKNIKVFQEDALSLDQVMNGGTIVDPDSGTSYQIDGLLDETLWTLGYVDAEIAYKYRGYSFTSTTVLDAVFKVAETLNALIVWNTITKTISFYDADNYGINRGFTINYGRYLKSLSRESKSDEMVTRLKVFGKDGMSIQALNINGQNYLEDYTYFLYPFQRDVNHNVIQHSYYMSDELCHAILDYSEYTQSKQGQFTSLLAQKVPFEVSLAARKNELAALQEEIAIINNNIDIYKSMEYDYTSLTAQKNAKQVEIDSKNGEITSINASLTSLDDQILTLKSSLKYSVFFTTELLRELSDYIIYKEFSNESYTEEQMLYDDAVKEFEKAKQPQIILTIDIINFMNIVEAQRDWDKLNLGDTITIRYGKLNINMEAKIIEISIDFESDSIGLTIANTKDIMTDEEKLIKMIYSNNAASTLLDLKSTKWDGIDTTTSKVNAIIENTWSAIKTGIEGGVNNTISITERGILVKNTLDPDNYLVIQNGVLAITNDNGNSWKHAITANGIVGERIYGKLLAGANLVIDASTSSGYKTFTVDESGVTIAGSNLIITGGLPPSQLDPSFKDSLVNLNTVYNGVVIGIENGLVITKSDNTIRTILNATEGFSFEKKNGTAWDKKLYYNAVTGNLVLDGEFNAKSIKINGVEVIAGGKLDGDMIDSIKVQQLDATTAKIGTAMIESLIVGTNVLMGPNAYLSWTNITGQPFIPTDATQIGGISSTYIDANGIWAIKVNANALVAGTISGVTIAIGTGNNIFKADANGIYLGNASYASAPFKVSMGGSLMATNAVISGDIATGNAGTTRVVLSSGLADINLYHNSSNIFRIEDDVDHTTIYSPTSTPIYIGKPSGSIYAYGPWDFTNATVTGVKAVFG